MAVEVLMIGNGGREHALTWKLKHSKTSVLMHAAPGDNAGIARIAKPAEVEATDMEGLVRYAKDSKIDYTVVGPELPLSLGIVDTFQAEKLPIFGPTKAAAKLETSKIRAIRFMDDHGIPHPQTTVTNDPNRIALEVSRKGIGSLVFKKDGLAAGKGAFPSLDDEELKRVLAEEFAPREPKLIQKKERGYEVSVLAFSDGNICVPIIPIHDYKYLRDGDQGPMTGGMGSYASNPSQRMSPELLHRIQKKILQPTIDGMKEEGTPYKGILYAGLMITEEGPKVLEYNARFGDPETQPFVMLLQTDLLDVIQRCIQGSLENIRIRYRCGAAVCIVLASQEYPNKSTARHEIKGLDKVSSKKDIKVFHAGTLVQDGKVVTNGGRVLGVTAFGNTLDEAIRTGYNAVGENGIHFEGMQHHTDIGT